MANLDIQDKLYNEMLSVKVKGSKKISYDQILSLKYLDMCVHEVLRKWPPTLVSTFLNGFFFKLPMSFAILPSFHVTQDHESSLYKRL